MENLGPFQLVLDRALQSPVVGLCAGILFFYGLCCLPGLVRSAGARIDQFLARYFDQNVLPQPDEKTVEKVFAQLKFTHSEDDWFTLAWVRRQIQLWLDKGEPSPSSLPESTGDVIIAYRDAMQRGASAPNAEQSH